MENANYVFTGWVMTGVVLCGYALRIAFRTRRAARSLGIGSVPQ